MTPETLERSVRRIARQLRATARPKLAARRLVQGERWALSLLTCDGEVGAAANASIHRLIALEVFLECRPTA